jgi:hypothetical protein
MSEFRAKSEKELIDVKLYAELKTSESIAKAVKDASAAQIKAEKEAAEAKINAEKEYANLKLRAEAAAAEIIESYRKEAIEAKVQADRVIAETTERVDRETALKYKTEIDRLKMNLNDALRREKQFKEHNLVLSQQIEGVSGQGLIGGSPASPKKLKRFSFDNRTVSPNSIYNGQSATSLLKVNGRKKVSPSNSPNQHQSLSSLQRWQILARDSKLKKFHVKILGNMVKLCEENSKRNALQFAIDVWKEGVLSIGSSAS